MVRDAGTCPAAIPASIAAPSASHPLKRCLCAMFLILASRRLPLLNCLQRTLRQSCVLEPHSHPTTFGDNANLAGLFGPIVSRRLTTGTDSERTGTKRTRDQRAIECFLLPWSLVPIPCSASYGVIGVVIPRSVSTFGFFSSTASRLWHAAQSCVIAVPFCAMWSPSWQRKQPG
jgi:hypothetical protein